MEKIHHLQHGAFFPWPQAKISKPQMHPALWNIKLTSSSFTVFSFTYKSLAFRRTVVYPVDTTELKKKKSSWHVCLKVSLLNFLDRWRTSQLQTHTRASRFRNISGLSCIWTSLQGQHMPQKNSKNLYCSSSSGASPRSESFRLLS